MKERVLYISMKYDYGDITRGPSYDYKNQYLALQEMGFEVDFFDYMEELPRLGRDQMNTQMVEKVKTGNYKYTFISFYTDQLKHEAIESLKKYTTTIGIFYDDTWRRDFTISWAKVLSYFTTTDIFGEVLYADMGLKNAIMMGYGFTQNNYYKKDIPYKYDISFVGGSNSTRRWLVKCIRKAGYKVETFGFGWPNGPISQEKMIDVFNQSKINLNLSNSVSNDIRYVLSGPRAFLNFFRSTKHGEQLKGRHIEINACGGFQLSFYADGIESVFEINKEIGVYQSIDDLINKIQFYLGHDDLRERIAKAGYEKAQAKFEYTKRLKYLFERMGNNL